MVIEIKITEKEREILGSSILIDFEEELEKLLVKFNLDKGSVISDNIREKHYVRTSYYNYSKKSK